MEMMDRSQEILIFTNKFVIGFLVIKLFQERKLFFQEDTPKEILDLYETLNLNLILLTNSLF